MNWTNVNTANLAKSFESAAGSLYNATTSAIDTASSRKMQKDKMIHEENMRNIEREREIMAEHFAIAKQNIDKEIHDHFSESIKNPDTTQYQRQWDEKFSSIMTADHLKSLGLNEEEAERYIRERGDNTKKAGDAAVVYYTGVSQKNMITENTKAKVGLLAIDSSMSDEEKLAEWEKIYTGSAKESDISGSNDPNNRTNAFNFLLTSNTARGKKTMEDCIAGGMSYSDALKKAEEDYDSSMDLIREKFGGDEDFAVAELDIKTTKETYMKAMKQYYAEQNADDYTTNENNASDAFAMLAEAKADGTVVDMSKLDEILNQNGLTEDSKSANSHSIRNAIIASANQQNQSIRGTSETKADLLTKSDEVELKTAIASYDTTLSGYYSYGEKGEVEVSDDDADGFGNFIADNLYTLTGGSETDPLSVKTRYRDLVDDYCEKHSITDPSEKMLIASRINDMALEMNLAEGNASSSSTSSSGSMEFDQMNATEAVIYDMIRDPNNYDTKSVMQAYNAATVYGYITPAFAAVYEKEFGTDGSKRKGDIYYTTAKSMSDSFSFRLSTMMSSDDKNALIWQISQDSSMSDVFDQWLRSNPDAINDTRKQAGFIDDLVDTAYSKKAGDDVTKIIDATYKMAAGKTFDSPGLDKATTAEILESVKNGDLDYLIDVDSFSTIKGNLYSDQAKTYSKNDLYDIVIGSITNGRYKSIKEMDKDKGLSDNTRQMYKNSAKITVAKATYEASQYKSAESVAKSAGGETAVTKGVGEGCREVRVKGYGIGCLDNAGFIYIATGDDKVEIYHIDPGSLEYKRVTSDSNSSLYPFEMDAGGVYETSYNEIRFAQSSFEQDMRFLDTTIMRGSDVMSLYNDQTALIRKVKTDEEKRNDPELRVRMTKALVTTRGRNTQN